MFFAVDKVAVFPCFNIFLSFTDVQTVICFEWEIVKVMHIILHIIINMDF